MRLRYAVLGCVVLIFMCHTPSQAETFKINYEATKTSDDSGRKKTEKTQKKQNTLTLKEQLDQEAAAAAAKGYKVGQTVKEKNGIIYKLAIDPKTRKYTFKLYRRVNKEKAVKKKTKIKQPRVVKHIRTKEADAERQARLLRQEQEERQKLEAQAKAEADRKETERLRLKKLYEGDISEGWQLKQWDVVVAAEHRYFEWRTILEKRSITTATGTVSDSEGVGVEDLFYTKTHADMLMLRLMVTQNVELFLEAGMTYEQFSDVGDMEPVYGGGIRYVIADAGFWVDAGVYLDVYARYLTGSLSSSYKDVEDNTFNTSLDFNEIDAGFEAGVRIYRLTLNAGINYGMYSEDVTRERVVAAPAISIYEDEMEEQDNLGLKIGLEYRVKTHWKVYGEWHSQFKEGALAGVSYQF